MRHFLLKVLLALMFALLLHFALKYLKNSTNTIVVNPSYKWTHFHVFNWSDEMAHYTYTFFCKIAFFYAFYAADRMNDDVLQLYFIWNFIFFLVSQRSHPSTSFVYAKIPKGIATDRNHFGAYPTTWKMRDCYVKIQRSVRVLEAILRFYFSIFRVFAERFLAMPITIVGKGILSCQSQLTEHQSEALLVNLCTTARQKFCFISDAGRKEVTFSLRSKSTEFSQKR